MFFLLDMIWLKVLNISFKDSVLMVWETSMNTPSRLYPQKLTKKLKKLQKPKNSIFRTIPQKCRIINPNPQRESQRSYPPYKCGTERSPKDDSNKSTKRPPDHPSPFSSSHQPQAPRCTTYPLPHHPARLSPCRSTSKSIRIAQTRILRLESQKWPESSSRLQFRPRAWK